MPRRGVCAARTALRTRTKGKIDDSDRLNLFLHPRPALVRPAAAAVLPPCSSRRPPARRDRGGAAALVGQNGHPQAPVAIAVWQGSLPEGGRQRQRTPPRKAPPRTSGKAGALRPYGGGGRRRPREQTAPPAVFLQHEGRFGPLLISSPRPNAATLDSARTVFSKVQPAHVTAAGKAAGDSESSGGSIVSSGSTRAPSASSKLLHLERGQRARSSQHI